jgi:hypothetical protein
MNFTDTLPQENRTRNAMWNRKLISRVRPGAMFHPHIPIIEADPDTYGTPDGFHTVRLGRNALWLANKDLSRPWRGEQIIDLSEPYSDRKVKAALSGLQAMRGARYLIFTELDESVDATSSPEAVGMYITAEGAWPTDIFGVDDSASEEWRIFSEVPANTTFLVQNTAARLLAFETPKT